MKLATSLAIAVLLCCQASVYGANTASHDELTRSQLEQEKNANVTTDVPGILEGGETIATAVNIPGLPYSDSGNTADNVHDYDAVCPYTGSLSRDVVYKYTPGGPGAIDIDLCNSGYDTKVYVYQNTTATLVACNDDAGCGADGFRSELVNVAVTNPHTYYIVVDGYGGANGPYELNVIANVPCIVACPSGSILENEPDCSDGYKDAWNSGCNSTPNTFSNLPCADSFTVCGRYGGFFHPASGFDYRDTDWYALPVGSSTGGVTWCVTGELDTLAGYLNADLGCGAPAFVDALIAGSCDTSCFNLPAGNFWLFVGTSGFGAAAGACGSDYTMTLDGLYGCGPISIEPKSWTDIKAQYSGQ
jgi:hypothetical protein